MYRIPSLSWGISNLVSKSRSTSSFYPTLSSSAFISLSSSSHGLYSQNYVFRHFSTSQNSHQPSEPIATPDPRRKERQRRLAEDFKDYARDQQQIEDWFDEDKALEEYIQDKYGYASEEEKQILRDWVKEESEYTLAKNVDRFRPKIVVREAEHTEYEHEIHEALKYKRRLHRRNWTGFRDTFSFPRFEMLLKQSFIEKPRYFVKSWRDHIVEKARRGQEEMVKFKKDEEKRVHQGEEIRNEADFGKAKFHDVIQVNRKISMVYPEGFTIHHALHHADYLYVQKHAKDFNDIEELKLLRNWSIDLLWQTIARCPTWTEAWIGTGVMAALTYYVPYNIFYYLQYCTDVGGFFYLGVLPLAPLLLVATPMLMANLHRAATLLFDRYQKRATIYEYHLCEKAFGARIRELGGDPQSPLTGPTFHSTEHIIGIAKKFGFTSLRDVERAKRKAIEEKEKAERAEAMTANQL